MPVPSRPRHPRGPSRRIHPVGAARPVAAAGADPATDVAAVDAEHDAGHDAEQGGAVVDPPLTRERVLATALSMIDAESVEALSMRRLGQALHCDPMRLYRYAESKAALLDAVTELVLIDFRIPPAVDGDWESALRTAAGIYRDIALAHPRMVPLMVTRPLSTPLGLRPPGTLRSLEQLLDLFLRAGFDDTGALHAYRFFVGFLTGHALNEVQELVNDPDEADALLQLGLYMLPRGEFPRMRLLAPVLAMYDGARELEEGLDIVVHGLRAWLDGRPTRTPDHSPERGPE